MFALTAFLLSLGLAQRQFPACALRDLPFSIVGPSGPVGVLEVSFQQGSRDSDGVVTIRNDGSEPLDGVLIQVELLDALGHFLSGLPAEAATGRPAREVFKELPSPADYGASVVSGGEAWKTALASGESSQIYLRPSFVLPSCPAAAAVGVFAIMAGNHNWQRLSPAMLRQMAVPAKFRTSKDKTAIPFLRARLAHLQNLAVLVRVDGSGGLTVLETQPVLSANQKTAFETFLRPRRFVPSIDQTGPFQQELTILFRFGKEQYDALIPEMRDRFAAHPLLVIGVSDSDLSGIPDL